METAWNLTPFKMVKLYIKIHISCSVLKHTVYSVINMKTALYKYLECCLPQDSYNTITKSD